MIFVVVFVAVVEYFGRISLFIITIIAIIIYIFLFNISRHLLRRNTQIIFPSSRCKQPSSFTGSMFTAN